MVATDTEAYKVKSFVEKNKYIVPVLYSNGKVEADYKIPGTPTTFIIDRQGIVQHTSVGYSPGVENVYKKKLQALLASPPVGEQH